MFDFFVTAPELDHHVYCFKTATADEAACELVDSKRNTGITYSIESVEVHVWKVPGIEKRTFSVPVVW